MPVTPHYRPAPRFPELGDGFADPVQPARFPQLQLRFRNQHWAERIGLGDLGEAEWEQRFARFEALPENLPEPLALRYHGHQFRVYNPNIGDGRGFLFAQVEDPIDGRLLDLATKGSGRTPWSRDGDGRLTLKGGVREVLATEMLEALGVYTSKSLSLFETGESLHRNDEPSPTRSSVLVRLGHSHIRFGTFQRYLALGEPARLALLCEHCVRHYAPEADVDADKPTAFFRIVLERSAALCASWMVAGFVHGVLNTDNMNVNGESFDYGPYRFLPTYDPSFVAAYFDHAGLYAFGRQPESVFWNLARLGDALAELTQQSALAHVLGTFPERFLHHYRRKLLARLGLVAPNADVEDELQSLCRAFLEESRVGHDQFFFDWWGGAASESRARRSPEAARYAGPGFAALRRAMDACGPRDPARLGHPYFQGERPASLLIEEIETIWTAIAERDDWSLFQRKIDSIREMGEAMGLATSEPAR